MQLSQSATFQRPNSLCCCILAQARWLDTRAEGQQISLQKGDYIHLAQVASRQKPSGTWNFDLGGRLGGALRGFFLGLSAASISS